MLTIETPNGLMRVRKGSWVNWFTRADGTTIGQTLHLRRRDRYGTRFIAHEIGHAVRWQGGFWPIQILHYLLSPAFRRQEEAAATAFSQTHFTEPWVSGVTRRIEAA